MNNHEEREAFEKLPDINAILHNSEFGFNEGINQYYHPNHAEHRLSYAFLMGAWLAWQARAKAQAVPEVITIGNELQSWVAVWSFRAKNDGEDYVVVDANLLAEKIEKLTGANA